MQKARRQPLLYNSHRPSTVCKLLVSGSISLRYQRFFSPFPHGTSSLSVINEYLALESGLPRFKPGFTCPVLLRCRHRQYHPFAYGAITLYCSTFQKILLGVSALYCRSYNPKVSDFGLGSSHFARRYYGNLILISFPLLTKMFQFSRSRFLNLCIQYKDDGVLVHRVAPFGFLRVDAFVQLTEDFRRYRVLHRLLMPRHPPAALTSLTK